MSERASVVSADGVSLPVCQIDPLHDTQQHLLEKPQKLIWTRGVAYTLAYPIKVFNWHVQRGGAISWQWCLSAVRGLWVGDLIPARASAHTWHPHSDTLSSVVHPFTFLKPTWQPRHTLICMCVCVCYPTWLTCPSLFVCITSFVCVRLCKPVGSHGFMCRPRLIGADLISSQLADVEQ